MRHSTYKNKIPTFFKIGIHSMQGAENHYEARSYNKKSTKKLQATENLFRKNLKLKDVC